MIIICKAHVADHTFLGFHVQSVELKTLTCFFSMIDLNSDEKMKLGHLVLISLGFRSFSIQIKCVHAHEMKLHI